MDNIKIEGEEINLAILIVNIGDIKKFKIIEIKY